jgi:hypothetical protein
VQRAARKKERRTLIEVPQARQCRIDVTRQIIVERQRNLRASAGARLCTQQFVEGDNVDQLGERLQMSFENAEGYRRNDLDVRMQWLA